MIIINFSHPLTETQLSAIKALTDEMVDRIIDIPIQFDDMLPFQPQLAQVMNTIPLENNTYQTQKILINPPALNFITAVLIAELHGRMGYFPTIIRLRLAENSLPSIYEVAEIINLNQMRTNARQRRFGND